MEYSEYMLLFWMIFCRLPPGAGVMNYDNPQTPHDIRDPSSPASSYTGTTNPLTPKTDTG